MLVAGRAPTCLAPYLLLLHLFEQKWLTSRDYFFLAGEVGAPCRTIEGWISPFRRVARHVRMGHFHYLVPMLPTHIIILIRQGQTAVPRRKS